ncbi:MAG: GNAT family N-acetyltransferase [Alphaproteobacteria bacterium]|nr:GNAT family N-acetyltransferase [Alphaproteobacteria bacterium]
MIVRRARKAEIPALARIAADSYRAAFAGILERRALESRDAAFFAERFASVWRRLRVATGAGRPVGFSLVTRRHLDMLFVDPGFVGRGAGRALLREAESRGTCTLECFRDNAQARRFYELAGWRLVRSYERDFIGRARAFVLYEKTSGP